MITLQPAMSISVSLSVSLDASPLLVPECSSASLHLGHRFTSLNKGEDHQHKLTHLHDSFHLLRALSAVILLTATARTNDPVAEQIQDVRASETTPSEIRNSSK